jgi:siroheme synthase (precorrin-2 oxidase/ferrochelatase)
MPGDKPVPLWERRFPGRFQYELDDLKAAGADVVIDDAMLAAEGRLVLDVTWPRPDGRKILLRAIYPDEFPYTKPEVIDPSGRLNRHSSPIGRNLCLLRRGTHNWRPSWTLRRLLDEQLEKCIAAATRPLASETISTEEHMGEPMEFWWNARALSRSYCLVDSGWKLDPAVTEGRLKLRVVFDETHAAVPRVRALVQEVQRNDGAVLASWSAPIPRIFSGARTMMIPWARLKEAPVPCGEPSDFDKLIYARPAFQAAKYAPQRIDGQLRATVRAVTYPTELTWRTWGDGWAFSLLFGRKPANLRAAAIAAYRGGESDIGARVPAVAALRGATIVVVGAGAIGAPIILELARNGCKVIRIVEHDHVEPGNSIRWPFGVTAWGEGKGEALQRHIHQEYPGTTVELERHAVGSCAFGANERGTDAVLTSALSDADLVIDASAEEGVNFILNNRCRAQGIPLITANATPTLEGGVVARFLYGYGGCRMCLEHAWAAEEIPEPRGIDAGDVLTQPAGCAERTFHGSSFDLTEISLQAVRMAVDTLSDAPRYPMASLVQLVSFRDHGGNIQPPSWTSHPLPTHPKCECPRK